MTYATFISNFLYYWIPFSLLTGMNVQCHSLKLPVIEDQKWLTTDSFRSEIVYFDNCEVDETLSSIRVDSLNGRAIYKDKKEVSLGSHFYVLWKIHLNCTLYLGKSVGVLQDWGDYFYMTGDRIEDFGYLRQGVKQGEWATYITCGDSVLVAPKENYYNYEADWSPPLSQFYRPMLREYYKNGFRHGKYTVYDVYFQKPLYETTFTNGTGYYKDYYPINGMPIQREGLYVRGRKVGKWIYYTPLGKQTIVEYPK